MFSGGQPKTIGDEGSTNELAPHPEACEIDADRLSGTRVCVGGILLLGLGFRFAPALDAGFRRSSRELFLSYAIEVSGWKGG